MTRSESINELATALAKAQGEIEGASKDAKNPHFNAKYATLASVWDACRGPLTKHGLSVVQLPRLVLAGDGLWIVECETLLLHVSGQFIGETWAVPMPKADAHGAGSALTYSRRQSLASIVGIAPEDDDGNAAVSAAPPARMKSQPQMFTVTVKIRGVVVRPAKDGGEKFIITADDQQTYQTFTKAHAEAAKSAQQAGVAVEIQYRQEAYGRQIVSIVEVGTEAPPL
jgi:hypothetical protein